MTEDRVPTHILQCTMHDECDLDLRSLVAEQPAPPLRPRFCVSCEGQHDEMKHALEQDRDPIRLEVLPGWLADEYGGEYYRREDVDALLASAHPVPPLDVDAIVEVLAPFEVADRGFILVHGTARNLADAIAARIGSAPSRSEPEDDPISDSRQPEDGPPPGRWPR